MVERHLLARRGERVARRLRAGVGRGVDDPRAARARPPPPPARAACRRPSARRAPTGGCCGRSKSPITTSGSRRPSRRTISSPHRRRGGRGQRQPDRRAERLGLRAEPHVVRPEVVAPLADQVRLVHGEQPRPRAAQRLPGLCVAELLRREEDERRPARTKQQRRARAPADCCELRTMAGRPASRRCATWSSCSAISGETTTVGPVRSSPASS